MAAPLPGYDGRFGLRAWPGAGRSGAPVEMAADDLAALRAEAARLIAQSPGRAVDLLAWNFELNDWVRLETVTPA